MGNHILPYVAFQSSERSQPRFGLQEPLGEDWAGSSSSAWRGLRGLEDSAAGLPVGKRKNQPPWQERSKGSQC